MSTPTTLTTTPHEAVRRRALAFAGAATFLVAYLLVAPVAGAISDADIPRPDDPASVLVAYYSENGGAAFAGAGLQALSVLGFAVFGAVLVSALSGTRHVARLRALVVVSVLAMLVSSALTVALPVIAADATPSTVATLREASFYAGGVVNVSTLGLFVLLALRGLDDVGLVGRWGRRLGRVAGALALLSLLSLASYYANLFLPLGRMLIMVWTVTVAVGWLRSTSSRRS